MKISKKRLLEIEKELNGLTIKVLCNINSVQEMHIKNAIPNQCPHCNVSRGGGAFRLQHFDNCKLKGVNLEEFNTDIQTMYRMECSRKYNIPPIRIYDYAKFHNIPLDFSIRKTSSGYTWKRKNEVEQVTCSHCKRSGGGPAFTNKHFDNCFLKGINRTEFHKELMEHSYDLICEKYGINRVHLWNYTKFHKIKAKRTRVKNK